MGDPFYFRFYCSVAQMQSYGFIDFMCTTVRPRFSVIAYESINRASAGLVTAVAI